MIEMSRDTIDVHKDLLLKVKPPTMGMRNHQSNPKDLKSYDLLFYWFLIDMDKYNTMTFDFSEDLLPSFGA